MVLEMLPKHEKERERMNRGRGGKGAIFPFLTLCVSVVDGK